MTPQWVPEDWERALAVVAHPDDLEYGAASAIARWTDQGRWVGYVLATAGEAGIEGMDPAECGPLRMEEERVGAAAVGVDTVEFLGHSDGIVEASLTLRRDVARQIRRFRPDVLILCNYADRWSFGGFNMADHRAVGVAALDAARDAGNRWVFPELLHEGWEPWSGVTRVFVNESPTAAHWVDVSATIDRGVTSLRAHHQYLAGLGTGAMSDPDTFLRTNAARSGTEVGTTYAVRFEVIDL